MNKTLNLFFYNIKDLSIVKIFGYYYICKLFITYINILKNNTKSKIKT